MLLIMPVPMEKEMGIMIMTITVMEVMDITINFINFI
jgi:hypothetical protein